MRRRSWHPAKRMFAGGAFWRLCRADLAAAIASSVRALDVRRARSRQNRKKAIRPLRKKLARRYVEHSRATRPEKESLPSTFEVNWSGPVARDRSSHGKSLRPDRAQPARGAVRRRSYRAGAEPPRPTRRLSRTHAGVSGDLPADAHQRLRLDRRPNRGPPLRQFRQPYGAGDHDRHRLFGSRRNHQGGFFGQGADHRGLDLDDGDDRHPDRRRILFSGRRDYGAHLSALILLRGLEKKMPSEHEAQ